MLEATSRSCVIKYVLKYNRKFVQSQLQFYLQPMNSYVFSFFFLPVLHYTLYSIQYVYVICHLLINPFILRTRYYTIHCNKPINNIVIDNQYFIIIKKTKKNSFIFPHVSVYSHILFIILSLSLLTSDIIHNY